MLQDVYFSIGIILTQFMEQIDTDLSKILYIYHFKSIYLLVEGIRMLVL